MKAVSAVFSGAALLFASASAEAAGHSNGFGEKGQFIISADRLVTLFGYTRSSVDIPINPTTTLTQSRSGTGISLLFGRDLSAGDDPTFGPINVHTIPRVAFDVTIIPHLTLGTALAFDFGLGGTNKNVVNNTTQELDAPRFTAIGFAPRVGWIFNLSDMFAIWPRGGIGFYSVSTSFDNPINNNTAVQTVKQTDTLFSIDLDPEFVFVPVEHFFITAGPLFDIPISGTRSVTRTTNTLKQETSVDASLFHFGLTASIGGWVDIF